MAIKCSSVSERVGFVKRVSGARDWLGWAMTCTVLDVVDFHHWWPCYYDHVHCVTLDHMVASLVPWLATM